MNVITEIEQKQVAQLWITGRVWAGDLMSKWAAHRLLDIGAIHCDSDGMWSVPKSTKVTLTIDWPKALE